MSLKDTFTRGFVWKLAGLLAIMLVSYVMTGEAQAHTTGRSCVGGVAPSCDKGEALSAASDASQAEPHCRAAYPTSNFTGYTFAIKVGYPTDNSPGGTNSSYSVQYTATPPPGGGSMFTCSTTDLYAYNIGCSSRTNQTQPTPQLATEKCVAGCKFKAETGYATRANANLSDGTTGTVYYATMIWTGDTCTGGTINPKWDEQAKPKEQECTAAGSGQSYCVKKTGENCYTAASGRMICWTLGETGQKTDGSTLQVAATGNSPPSAPLAPPPAGQSWVQGPGTTNVTNVNNNGVTNVTNITNFTTSGGSPAGSTNSGEGNTGQSGNGQCTSNCSTGSTGGTGTNVDLTETNSLLGAIKTATENVREFFDGIGNEAGTLDTTEGETQQPDTVWGDNPNELDLDASGFGMAGGGCPPAPSYMGYSLDAGGNLCMFASIIGALVLAAGYVQAAYIIGRA